MKWIFPEERLPKIGQKVLVEYTGGDFLYKEYSGLQEWWKRNIKRWLDESEISFTIDDMKEAYKTGQLYGFEKCGQGYSNETLHNLMQSKYDIDINK